MGNGDQVVSPWTEWKESKAGKLEDTSPSWSSILPSWWSIPLCPPKPLEIHFAFHLSSIPLQIHESISHCKIWREGSSDNLTRFNSQDGSKSLPPMMDDER